MITWYPAPSVAPLTSYTGMCVVTPPNPEDVRRRQEDMERALEDARVATYFEGLGYSVSQDWNRKGASWHEISDTDGLIVQIDQGVPLTDIVGDFTLNADGKPGVSKTDWTYCTEGDDPRFHTLLQRVKQNQFGGVQDQFPLS